MIERPEIGFDEEAHAYTVDGEPVPGVSTIAKVAQNPAPLIAWAFKIGREGEPHETPWNTRQRAADRGNAVHAVLERLAQDDDVPDHDEIEAMPEEERGHVRSLLAWFLWARPEFEGVEVMVGSRAHRYAGRYDIRCRIDARKLVEAIRALDPEAHVPARLAEAAEAGEMVLVLVDLKTSASVYASHFAQLAGYEGASVEMRFEPTVAQFVLRTSKDGSFTPATDFVRSPATHEDFLAFLACYRSVEGLTPFEPREIERARKREEARVREAAKREVEATILARLGQDPAGMTSRALAAALDLPGKAVSAHLQRMKGRGEIACEGRTWVPLLLVESPPPGEIADAA